MSPEQALSNRELDRQSDVYSLGVVLFQALTSKLPYKADTPMGTALAHVTQPIPRLSDINVELPSACETVVTKAMAKEPEDRFAAAGEMADTLAGIVRGETISSLSDRQPETAVASPSAATGLEADTPQPRRGWRGFFGGARKVTVAILALIGLCTVLACILGVLSSIAQG
jgi:serine/threonine-protein kinase